MQKQIEEEKARVKSQHDLYEHVRSERNRFAKLQVLLKLLFAHSFYHNIIALSFAWDSWSTNTKYLFDCERIFFFCLIKVHIVTVH